jgi:hypothetical protein
MSYTKLETTLDATSAVADLLAQNKIDTSGVADELLAAGAAVTLDSGQTVWCSCIVHDRPETPPIDLLVAAIEFVDGAPRTKANGQIVGTANWRQVWPAPLASWGVDTVRKACLMLALGEPQPQVPIPDPAEGGPTEQDVFQIPATDAAASSIRAAISAADQLAAPLADVL